MKKYLIFTILGLLTTGLWAQNCDLYIPLEEGKGFEYQNFSKRDKLEGISQMRIKEVNSQGNQTEALFAVKYLDKKEELLHEGEYTIVCKGNELIIDIESMLGQEIMQSFEGMEISMTNIENISLPGNISVGDKLPDAHMEMKVSMGNMDMSNMKFTTQNRQVVAKETITTPAGTFDTYKITYENVMDSRTMGMSNKNLSKGVEYYAPGVGNVRSEFYDDKDRLQSYTVLSEIY